MATHSSILPEETIDRGAWQATTHGVARSEMKSLSRVRLFATPWTVAYQAPPSMGFSMQECWSGLPFPSPGDLPSVPEMVKEGETLMQVKKNL